MKSFDFGVNWQDFSRQIGPEKIEAAAQSLRFLLQREDLKDLSFLDVGCGSGLFSIAAFRLGASRVVGIDINSLCISVSEQNRRNLAPQAQITFLQGSILDKDLLISLGNFDVVYAWGVLHHTGAMWPSIRLVAERVAPDGQLALAIYNRHVTSPLWRKIKRFYNRIPSLGQQAMIVGFAGVIYIAKFLVTRRNPLEKQRGMDFWHDVVDWVGGYPYEYAAPQEVEAFVRSLGFDLQNFVPAQVPTGCNEFVFKRRA